MASKALEARHSAAGERDLIESIRQGAREEYHVLVRRYQDRVYTLVYRLLGDPGEAEDIAQEAFLRAYRNLGRFSGKSSFYTWLYRIATNLALSRLRYLERRVKTLSLDGARDDPDRQNMDPADPAPSPRDRAIEQDVEKKILQALDRLPDEIRAVVVLRDVEDRAYEEIAELTGLPLGTVKSRLHQGRAKLQELLSDFK